MTRTPPQPVRLTGLDRTFATTGLPDSVVAARSRAEAASSHSGNGLGVGLMGGGATIGSALEAGLVDTLTLRPAPVVLGSGTPLSAGGTPRTPVRRNTISTSNAAYPTYDILWPRRTVRVRLRGGWSWPDTPCRGSRMPAIACCAA
ncbi:MULTISPECIES: dihydrofolate reductase family protein [unclassified Streptomyces]|uniref:dihydrofolate reductase family protein n=1 Tax=unclassified Streptomyces TaxID=2593676 RepID=UPI0038122D4E